MDRGMSWSGGWSGGGVGVVGLRLGWPGIEFWIVTLRMEME